MGTAADWTGIGDSSACGDPAGAGRRDGHRTGRAIEEWRVNGVLMERAAAVLRTAEALGVDPAEFARTLRATRALGAAR